MTSIKRIAAAAALVFALAVPAPAPAADQTPYEINVIVSLTGAGSFLGLSQQRALTIFENSVNAHGGIKGRPLQFAFLDDQTLPQVAVQLAIRHW